jgi:Cysteine-rich secretory protein family
MPKQRSRSAWLLALAAVALPALVGCGQPLADAPDTDTAALGISGKTLGKTTVGAHNNSVKVPNVKRVNVYALTEAAVVQSFWVYLRPNAALAGHSELFRGVLYADNGGAPGALLGTTRAFAVRGSSRAGWRTAAFPAPVTLAPGTYWIGYINGGTGGVASSFFDLVGGARAYNADVYSDGPSRVFGAANRDDKQLSMFVTYTVPSGGGCAGNADCASGLCLSNVCIQTSRVGKASVGASKSTMTADRKRANSYVLPAGMVPSISLYLGGSGGTGSQAFRGVIYADAGGSPGALIATTDEIQVAASDGPAWRTLPFPSNVSIATDVYWIGYTSGPSSGAVSFYYDLNPGGRAFNDDAYADGPSDPFGPASRDGLEISMYVTVQQNPDGPPAGDPCVESPSGVDCTLTLLNRERAMNGSLPPLTLRSKLTTSAISHTQWMVDHNCFEHDCAGELTLEQRINATGYAWSLIGENIADGYDTAQDVVAAWMASPGHRANILDPRFRDIGIARIECPSGCDATPYWTTDFGAPP